MELISVSVLIISVHKISILNDVWVLKLLAQVEFVVLDVAFLKSFHFFEVNSSVLVDEAFGEHVAVDVDLGLVYFALATFSEQLMLLNLDIPWLFESSSPVNPLLLLQLFERDSVYPSWLSSGLFHESPGVEVYHSVDLHGLFDACPSAFGLVGGAFVDIVNLTRPGLHAIRSQRLIGNHDRFIDAFSFIDCHQERL